MIEKLPDVLYADGFDEALIGHATHFCASEPGVIALYSRERMIEIVMRDGASADEADEYISFNVEGAFLGPLMPAFVVERW